MKPMKATRREILALAAIGALGPRPASAETASQPDEAALKGIFFAAEVLQPYRS